MTYGLKASSCDPLISLPHDKEYKINMPVKPFFFPLAGSMYLPSFCSKQLICALQMITFYNTTCEKQHLLSTEDYIDPV